MKYNNKKDDSRFQKHKVIDKIAVHFKPVLDNKHINKDNIELIKRHIKEVVDYSATLTEYLPDGSLIITPHLLENIPNEIISLMLDYLMEQPQPHLKQKDLYECALVNKQFYTIANPLLWHTPLISNADKLSQFSACLNSAQLEQEYTKACSHPYITAAHHVRRLDLQDTYWTDIEFSLLIPRLCFLETLVIGKQAKNISQASLKHVPRYCTQLTTLTLHTDISCPLIQAIGQHCHQLAVLSLSTEHLPNDTFKMLANCPLKTIELCRNHYHFDDRQFIGDSMVQDLTAFPLECLKLNGVLKLRLVDLFFGKTWPLLNWMEISDGTHIDDATMISFLKSHPQLKRFSASASTFSDESLRAMTGLTHLKLKQNHIITRDGVFHWVRHAHSLHHADFIFCEQISQNMAEFANSENEIKLDLVKMTLIRQTA